MWMLGAGRGRSENFGMRKQGGSNLEHVLGFFRLHEALSTVGFRHFGGNQPGEADRREDHECNKGKTLLSGGRERGGGVGRYTQNQTRNMTSAIRNFRERERKKERERHTHTYPHTHKKTDLDEDGWKR
jgi:hypothetical protein